jgi:hypothetical protein
MPVDLAKRLDYTARAKGVTGPELVRRLLDAELPDAGRFSHTAYDVALPGFES